MTYYYTNKIKEELGNNIKQSRKKLKKKQVEIAVDAGVNPSYYGKIERGLVNPSIEKVFRIVKALRVKSSDLLPF
ncbi:hypothetical protein A3B46_03280 [Candidatus Roizmanbacteria bacterium RIFCSPLOWO2_01_FULL_39_19]|nr:MAG: hypothetical protein A3B46_03280 [Candidatus Roizmanbacteria bacterium RIFCSPLOWO2_01_FULL_39_19]